MDVTALIRDGADQLRKALRRGADDGPLVLELDLTRGVIDAPPQNPVAMLRARQTPTMAAIREGLRAGAEDPDVAGLIVDLGPGHIAPAQADELAGLIGRFGEHKPTVAFAPTFGELGNGIFAYRLAAAAGDIWVQPSGMLSLAGVQARMMLLRGGFEKLGIEPEFAQRWQYKTAADTYAATEISEAYRESTRGIADSVLGSVVDAVATGRGLESVEVRGAVDDAPLGSRAGQDRGLVDAIGYRDEAYAHARRAWGGDDGEIRLRYVHRYAEKHGGGPLAPLLNRARSAVGVVSVHGAIVTGISQPGGLNGQTAGSDTVCAALRAAGRDEKVKAVVLRVDSPGGSYVASDAIRREVQQLREAGKPVVASMGQTAASGGYFVAMPCAEIVANPTTLTGSIGVLAGKLITTGLVDKLGLVREAVDAGRRAGMMAGTQPFTPEEWEVLNGWLDEVYADFTGKAAADRRMELTALEPLARGRVWTGADAARNGLVDHLGGLDLAIDRACELAGVDRDDLVTRPVPMPSPLSQLRGTENSEAVGAAGALSLSPGWEGLLELAGAALGIRHRGVLSLPVDIRLG
ncbi:protease-4 [Naumannella cuiyingiana]|uniref:Protease-4 n=1 Tax=Naumannella cuiyingiana TaxID=1347891 RepID=A0A7Z0IK04_9ACTN|nr:signal peptide peptidase SppA [Naumannella cuiyingiana]NYI69996.1 protease-4 [Naumannella cuiyingiana]